MSLATSSPAANLSCPHVVREEIRDGGTAYPELTRVLDVEWLRVVALDTLDRLRRFTLWTSRVGAGSRDLGEASVLAVAEELGAVALIDERDATRIGRAHGVNVHGTIWLLAGACRDGKLTEVGASNLVDTLAATGMRLPCTGADFPRYARANGLL
jgi:predicted nucleic acid-binding protein